jgi:hypothetical protein
MASPAETVTPVIQKQVPVRADVMPFFLCVSSLCRGMLIFSVSFQFYRMSPKRLMPFQIYMFQVLALHRDLNLIRFLFSPSTDRQDFRD